MRAQVGLRAAHAVDSPCRNRAPAVSSAVHVAKTTRALATSLVVALGRSAMPPKRKIGEAARAKRKELAETTTLNLDTAGASDSLATALHLVLATAARMRNTGMDSGEEMVGGYTIRLRTVENVVKLHYTMAVSKKVVYGSVQALADAEISREQEARTIGELEPEGIDLRSYGAMPTDGSRPPRSLRRKLEASVAGAARVLATPAARLYAVAACCEPKATVLVVEHEKGKGPRDGSDLRKYMSGIAVGGDEWRKLDPSGHFDWVLPNSGQLTPTSSLPPLSSHA